MQPGGAGGKGAEGGGDSQGKGTRRESHARAAGTAQYPGALTPQITGAS